jgi:hypothetical protein
VRNTGLRSDWTPSTLRDREKLIEDLERLLQDPLFRRSSRYSALLRYIVEMALDGKTAELKERTIGIDVFHRSIDYDTNADPVVRFCAGEIRKRLAQHYRSCPETLIEIELPIGSYVPVFHLRTPVPEHRPSASIVTTDIPEKAASQASEGAYVALSTASVGRQSSRPDLFPAHRTKLLILSAALLLLCSIAMFLRSELRPDPLKNVWGPLLNKAVPVEICTGSPPPEQVVPVESPDVSIKQHFLRPGHRVSLATASAIANISGFLEANNQPFGLSEAEANTIDTLRNRPLVLVNANNNKWTLLLLKPLRFHFESQGDLAYIIDREHPEHHDWSVDFTKPYLQQTEDYAIVARLFDKVTGRPVLVVAGIGSNGTEAAGQFSVSSDYIVDLAQGAPRGWEKMNFEAVLKVGVIQGHLGLIQMVSKCFW